MNNQASTDYITRSGRRVRKPQRYNPNGITSEALKDKNFEKIDPRSIQGSSNRSEMIMDKLGNTCNSKKQDLLEIGHQAAADRVLETTTIPAIDIQTSSLQNIPEESWHFSFFDDSLYKPPPKSKSTESINVSHPDENYTYFSNECVGSNCNVARKLFETTPEKQDYKRKNVCNGKDRTSLENWNSSHSVSQCNNSKDIFEISKTVPVPEILKHKASSNILLENLSSNSKFCSVSELDISNDNLEISKYSPVISTTLTDQKNDIRLHDVTSNSKPSKDISETTYASENILSKKSSEVLSPKNEQTFNGFENDFPTYFSNLAIEPILDSNNISFDLRNLNAVTALANDCILNKSSHCASFSNEFLPNTDFKVSASKYDFTTEPGFSQNCFNTPVLFRRAKDSFIAAYVDLNSNSSPIMNKNISNNMDVLNSSVITSEEVDMGSEESLNDRSVFSYEESPDIKQSIPDDEYVTKRERHSPKFVKQSFETFEKCTTTTEGDIHNSSAANDSECVNGSVSNYSFNTTVSAVFEENVMTVNSSVTSEMKSETVEDTSASESVSSVFSFKQFFDSNSSGLDIIKSELTDVGNITVEAGSSNHDFNSADLNNETAKKEMGGAKSKFNKANVDEFDTGVVVGIEVDESLKLSLKKARKNSFEDETLSDFRTDDFKLQDKLESQKEKLTQIDRQDPLFSFNENRDVLSQDSIVPLNPQARDLLSQQKSILESGNEDIENILSPEVYFNTDKLIDNKKSLYWSTRKSVSSPQLEHKKSELASKIPERRRSVSNIPVLKVGHKFDYHAASKFTASDLKVRRCYGLKSFLAESLCETAPQRKRKSYAPVAGVMKEKINVVTPLKSHNSYNVRNCIPDLPKSAPRRCPKKFQNIQSPVAQYIKGQRVLGSLKTVKGHDTINSTLPSRRSKASRMSQISS